MRLRPGLGLYTFARHVTPRNAESGEPGLRWVIQKHQFESWLFFRPVVPGDDPARAKYWRVLRREVRVEMVIRGAEPRKTISVYEIFWAGGASAGMNLTQDGERDLFLVRVENGKYHVVRDSRRSIFPITSGPHSHLPLNDSHALWERIALMNWWMPRNDAAARIDFPYFQDNDPGRTLSQWRTIKLERGLVRHPSPGVSVPACRALLLAGRARTNAGKRCPIQIGHISTMVVLPAVPPPTSRPAG